MNAIVAERTDAGMQLAACPANDDMDPIGRIGALFLDPLDVVVDDDATARDHPVGRLAPRVHRWDGWGERAHGKGSEALTQLRISPIGLILTIQAPGGWA